MKGHFISPDNCLWRECLDRTPHDFHHMPGYVRLCAGQERGEPLAFLAEEGENRLLVPMIVRPIETDRAKRNRLYDATSPYGYPSPLLMSAENKERRDEFLERAIKMLLSSLRERGVVTAFLRLHPILLLPLEPFRRHGMLVHHGDTVSIDLTQTEEELWHQTRPRFRSQINRTRRNGYVAEFDRAWARFDEFLEIYTRTMQRVGAADSYFFPRQYFLQLKEVLQDSLHLCVVHLNGSVACAALYSEIHGIVQYHLSGSRPSHAKNDPMKLMMDFVRSWAKKRGNHTLHLGGGKGGSSDSLFQFKAGFSKQRSAFYTWRVVVDVLEHDALVREWKQLVGTEAEDVDDFFPPYRRPASKPDGSSEAAVLPLA